MTNTPSTGGATRLDADRDRYADGNRNDNGGSNWWKWLLALLVIAGLVIGGFFLLGGDADVDVDPGQIEAPDVDADLDAPDVDITTPDVDVDVDSGDVDVQEGDADATLDPNE
jgi:hypothetical protein